ncbi:MAG: PQQ-binding-like beta-propeller repeat protein, partial [Thermomicrobiales bacterium]
MTWFARTPSRIGSEALLDYWDDVIDRSPTTPVPPVQVPAEIGALVRTINNADITNPDYPAYEDRLLQALLTRQKEITHMNAITAPIAPIPPSRPVTHVKSPRLAQPRRPAFWMRGKWIPALEVATIILLLLASATGIWLAGDRNDSHRIVAPDEATPTTEASPDVPMYRGNPARTGQMPGPGPEGTPVELWRAEVEGEIHSAPAVVDGVLYVGAGDGGVYALDTATGETHWIFTGSSPVSSSPAVHNDVVYIGSGDGTLYALNATDGTVVWTFPGAAANAAVTILNGVVYTGSSEGYLYALQATTGEEYWRAPLNEAASRSPAISGGVVYMGSVDGVLHTFNAITGEPGWALQLEGGVLATTVISGGVVYQNTFEGDVNHAYALDAATSEELWRFDSPSGQDFGFLPPAVGNGLVYLPSNDHHVYAVDVATGKLAWQFETGDQVSAAPALVGDTLYVGGRDQNVYALDAETGAELWRITLQGEIDFGPVVVGGAAYAGTTFGYLYAIGGSGTAGTGSLATPSDGATPTSTEATPVTSTPEPAASPEAAADLATLLWSTTGGPDALDRPSDVTIAPDGTIWVADGGNSRFQIFAPDGTLIETWGISGSGDGDFD